MHIDTLDNLTPATDVPRRVPGPLAPAEYVTVEPSGLSPDGAPTPYVRLVGKNEEGARVVSIELPRAELASIAWFSKVIRLYLMWRYRVQRLRLVRSG